MGLERYVVDAVVLEGRSPRQLASLHGISKSWVYQLVTRFRAGGYEALQPRSRRPRSCSHQVGMDVQVAILQLRHELAAAGHDCGPHTIAHHLSLTDHAVPSVATIWRILSRHGLITPQPHKRPRSSFIRFEAALPNELWQADSTHWQLADGSGVEILNVIDDHSRMLLAADAFVTVKAADVVQSFYTATDVHGYPAAFLTDNAPSSAASRGTAKSPLSPSSSASVSSASTPPHTTPRPAARWNGSTRP